MKFMERVTIRSRLLVLLVFSVVSLGVLGAQEIA